MIWLSWAIYLGGLAWTVAHSEWIVATLWLVLAPLAQGQYIRRFPSISAMMGYGPITDHIAAVTPSSMPIPEHVVLYTALGCPFCPIMEQRLEELRATMGFSLEKVDVTLRPGLLTTKKIRSVPAVEIHGQILTGLVTSRDLAAAITAQQVPATA